MLLLLIAVAGVPLLLTYKADPAGAHDAVASMTHGLLGWMRGVHAWAAGLLVVLVLLHPLSAWLSGRESRVPKRVWLTGSAILAVVLATYLTGTVLRFDHRGWEALEHLDQGLSLVGLSLVGDRDPTSAPLDLLFLFHVLLVPVLLLSLLTVHLMRRGGLVRSGKRLGRHVRRALPPAVSVVVGVAALGVLFPPRFGPAPIAGLEVTNPPWPFLWLVPVQDLLGPWGLILLPLMLVALGVAPWVTTGWSRPVRVGAVVVVVGVLTVLSVVAVWAGGPQ